MKSMTEDVSGVLAYYNQHAEGFFAETSKADMHENADRFLNLLPEESLILDFGCGSGRDSVYFLQKHYRVCALDGSEKMCRLAQNLISQYKRSCGCAVADAREDGSKVGPDICRQNGMINGGGAVSQPEEKSTVQGCIVRNMQFADFHEQNVYDGIWACASILHLPKAQLPDMFTRLTAALHTDGILYTSFKYGTFEGMRSGRYFTDLTENELRRLTDDVPGIKELKMWQTPDVRPERANEKWLNALFKKDR